MLCHYNCFGLKDIFLHSLALYIAMSSVGRTEAIAISTVQEAGLDASTESMPPISEAMVATLMEPDAEAASTEAMPSISEAMATTVQEPGPSASTEAMPQITEPEAMQQNINEPDVPTDNVNYEAEPPVVKFTGFVTILLAESWQCVLADGNLLTIPCGPNQKPCTRAPMEDLLFLLLYIYI